VKPTYHPKDTERLAYRNAQPYPTKYGLVFLKLRDYEDQVGIYHVYRNPHREIGLVALNHTTGKWSAYAAVHRHDGQPFVLVNVEGVDMTTAIEALQKKDPLNWSKDAEGNPIICYRGR
jgi:hypothetical protein